jgi:hypothetical protein
VEAEQRRRVLGPDALRRGEAEAQRGVHGHRDQDEPGAADALGVEPLDGEVEGGRAVAGSLEECGGERHAVRHVAELVGGDEEDLAGAAHAPRVGAPSATGGAGGSPAGSWALRRRELLRLVVQDLLRPRIGGQPVLVHDHLKFRAHFHACWR